MNILLIDDHPMLIQAYIDCLSKTTLFTSIPKFTIAYSYKDAFKLINEDNNLEKKFHFAFITQSISRFQEEHIYCGGDIALLIQKKNNDCKIIISVSNIQTAMVYDLLKRVQPNALMIKNDINSNSLLEAVLKVKQGDFYYSAGVTIVIQQIWNKNVLANDINRKILILLAKGYKIKEVQEIVLLSPSAIKRRIAHIKVVLDITNDSTLIKEACQMNFI